MEREEVHFIRERLSAYEEIWKRYIGNNGESKMPEVPSLPESEVRKRINFGEYMYTCLESLVCMRSLSHEAAALAVSEYPEYIRFLNILIAFQGHAGRLIDNSANLIDLVIKSDEKRREVKDILKEFYENRHTVLHGRKIPFAIYEKVILIPKLEGRESSQGTWTLHSSWDEVDEDLFEFLGDYLAKSVDEICKGLNRVLHKVLDPVKKIVEEFNIKLTPPTQVIYVDGESGIPPISGSNFGFGDSEGPPPVSGGFGYFTHL